MTALSDALGRFQPGNYTPPAPSRRGRGITLPAVGRAPNPTGSPLASVLTQLASGRTAQKDIKDFDYASKAIESEEQLNRALKKLVDNPDVPDEVKKQAKEIANRRGNEGTSASILGKILNVVDKPRSLVVAGVDELDEAINGETGDDTFKENLGGINARGVSYGDLLEDKGMAGGWQRRAAGLAGDIFLDPLTYLGGEKALESLGEKGLARAFEAAGMAEKAAEVAQKGKGVVTSADFAELAARGGPEFSGGLKFRVPGSTTVGRALGGGPVEIPLLGQDITRHAGKLSQPFRKATQAARTSSTFSKIMGKTPELEALFRSGDPELSSVSLKLMDAMNSGDDFGNRLSQQWLKEVVPDLRQFKNNKDNLRNFLEGDARAASQLEKAGLLEHAQRIKQWYGKVAKEATENGVYINQIEDYFTHLRTQAANQKLGRGPSVRAWRSDDLKATPEFARAYKQGDTFLGVTLEKGTVDEINQIAKSVIDPKDFVDLFEKDPFLVLPAYARMLGRRVGNETTRKMLRDAGLIRALDSSTARGALKKLTKAMERHGLLGEEAVGKAGRAEMGSALYGSERMAGARTVIDDADRNLMDLADTHGHTTPLDDASKEVRRARAGVDKEFEEARSAVDSANEAHDLTQQNAQYMIDQATQLREEVESLQGVRPSSATYQQAKDTLDEAMQWASYAAKSGDHTMKLTAALHVQAARAEVAMLKQGKKVASAEEVLAWARRSAGHPNGFLDLAEQELLDGFKPFLVNEQAHEVVADTLMELTKIQEKGGMAAFFGFYDKALQTWKKLAILTPGFHFRNAMGILWNNWVADASLGSLTKYVRNKAAYESGRETDQVFRIVEESGILDELGQIGYEAVTKGKISKAAGRTPFELSRRTGQNIEHVGRGWLAYDVVDEALRKGLPPEQAIQAARDAVYKYHFNYNDLSKFEKNVIRRVVPFYTWTRKNLPLQLEMMARNPGKFSRYASVRNAISSDEDEGVVPAYFGEMNAFRLPFDSEEGGTYLAPDLPFTRIGDFDPLRNSEGNFDPMASRLRDTVIGQTNPVIKLPLELWAGKRFFNDLPLNDERTAEIASEVERPFGDVPGLSWLRIPGILPLLELGGYAKRNKEGAYILGEKTAYTLEQLFPPFNRARRLAPTEARFQSRMTATWLSVALGINYRFNTNQEQNAELRRRQGLLSEIMGDLEEKGYDLKEDDPQLQPLDLLLRSHTNKTYGKPKKRTRKRAVLHTRTTAAPLVRALDKLGQSRRS